MIRFTSIRLQGVALGAALAVFLGPGWAKTPHTASLVPAKPIPSEDARNTKILNTRMQLPLPTFTTLEAWKQRKAALRQQILTASGLSPLPERTPMHPEIYGKFSGKGYTIEKVLLEPLPGFYLGGSLFRPTNGHAKHPAIVNPQGHWGYGRMENQPLFSGPALGISLARQGYVVFSYDMVGYTDTLQLPHVWGNAQTRLWSFTPYALQAWNAIRAVDFVSSLPDVDAGDVGAVGGSSGAAQSFMLAAVDDRIQFTALVSMVSSFMQGGDVCEGAPGLRMGTSNPEIADMIAPKPMLLVAGTVDWTRNTLRDEYPAMKKLYDLYGKPENIAAVQVEAPHNFNKPSREEVYKFLSRIHPGLTEAKELKEHDVSAPMVGQMASLWGRSLPSNALDQAGLFDAWKQASEAQNATVSDPAFDRERLKRVLAVSIPTEVDAAVTGTKILLTHGAGDRVPGQLIVGKAKAPTALLLDQDGASVALRSEAAAELRRQKRTLLAIDAFQTGTARAPRNRKDEQPVPGDEGLGGDPRFLTFNVTDDQARVQDVLTAISYVAQNSKGKPVDIYARGDAAVWALFAAAVSPTPVKLHLDELPRLGSDDDYLQHFNVPGILRAGGYRVARQLADR